MNNLTRTILAGLALAACGKGGTKEMAPLELGTSGYVVDAPKGWTVESMMKGFYDFKDEKAPQIMESSASVSSVEEIVKGHCDGRTVVDKGTLPAGGVFVACKGESHMMKGVTTTVIIAEVPFSGGDTKSLSCHYETDADPAASLALCKSMRKK